jgi:hypothetical protein
MTTERTPQYAASYFLKMVIRKKLDSKLLFSNYIRIYEFIPKKL